MALPVICFLCSSLPNDLALRRRRRKKKEKKTGGPCKHNRRLQLINLATPPRLSSSIEWCSANKAILSSEMTAWSTRGRDPQLNIHKQNAIDPLEPAIAAQIGGGGKGENKRGVVDG